MLWLIGLVLVLQAAFHWMLEPVIQAVTPWFELKFMPWVLVGIGLWLLSGGKDADHPS